MPIQPLLEELFRAHFPNPPASPEQLSTFEARMGWQLDDDLRAVYLHCNGAELFRRPDSPYRILPLSGIVRARVAIYGEDTDEWGPASLYAVCAVGDSDYVAVDVNAPSGGRFSLHDCWHEAFNQPKFRDQIADSFSEFLGCALVSGGRRLYWLGGRGRPGT